MRIAMVSPVYPPYRGGMGIIAERYVTLLRAQGHVVDVFTPTTLRPLFCFGNAAILPSLLWRLRSYNVIHLHYPFYGAAFFVLLGALLGKVPYVLTYHMRAMSRDWRNILFALQRVCIEPFIVRGAKAVGISSVDYAQYLKIHHQNIHEIPFSVDTSRFFPKEYSIGVGQGEVNILFVGGMDSAHDFKGIHVFLDALALLPSSCAWRATLVGEGNMRQEYMRYAQEKHIAEKVHFTGAVADRDLPEVYRSADIHVLCSTSSAESFGLVTIEAAASGLPSVVSDLPGVRTTVVDGITGHIVATGDAMALAAALQSLIDHPADRLRMGIAARARAMEMYSLQSEQRALHAMYSSL
jgi:glycosyltransferase involved in cell wall biosynthesis